MPAQAVESGVGEFDDIGGINGVEIDVGDPLMRQSSVFEVFRSDLPAHDFGTVR